MDIERTTGLSRLGIAAGLKGLWKGLEDKDLPQATGPKPLL